MMKQAAVLAAQGMPRADIIATCGCTLDQYTSWQQRGDWIEYRDKENEKALKRLLPMLDSLRIAAVDAHEEALRVLVEALGAMTADGKEPLMSVRLQAAGMIINSPIVRGMVDASKAPGAEKPAQIGNGTVNIRIVTRDDGRAAIEYIDGEAEEVTNELGTGDPDGDDHAEDVADAGDDPGLDTDGDPDF